jgi:hypothetical protein
MESFHFKNQIHFHECVCVCVCVHVCIFECCLKLEDSTLGLPKLELWVAVS